jgi:prepilin signal peptidase PulO-like enzyme (type II secretory pathway)
MGFADAKLMLGIGWVLGIGGSVNAIIMAFWIAAAVSVIWMFFTYKSFKPRTEVPFGPYLVLGMYLVLIFHIQVLDTDLLRDIVMSLL